MDDSARIFQFGRVKPQAMQPVLVQMATNNPDGLNEVASAGHRAQDVAGLWGRFGIVVAVVGERAGCTVGLGRKAFHGRQSAVRVVSMS